MSEKQKTNSKKPVKPLGKCTLCGREIKTMYEGTVTEKHGLVCLECFGGLDKQISTTKTSTENAAADDEDSL